MRGFVPIEGDDVGAAQSERISARATHCPKSDDRNVEIRHL
jgi:hypothetical protein